MLTRLTKITLLATLLTATAALGTGCTTSDDDSSATLTINNQESFEITDIYINPSGFDQSDNILSDGPLDPGDSVQISVDCGTYDVEIVDESGADCEITDYSLCASDDTWDITDSFCALDARINTTPKGTPIVSAPSIKKLVK